jgi:hypothetical protein
MNINDEIIRKSVFSKNGNGRRKRSFPKCLTDEEIEYLFNKYPDALTIEECSYRLKHNINVRPVCKICGKSVKYSDQPNAAFSKTCSLECGNKFRHINKTIAIQNKYGVDNVFRLDSVKKQIENTCIRKYGKISYLATPYCQNLSHSREAIIKGINTMKAKGVFKGGTSSQEIKILDILKTKFPDVIHSYKDDILYPFNCDFYIPSEDIWIELNFHWTHGFHRFNPNDKNDIIKLEIMKSKHDRYYDRAINVWTNSDPLKLKTAIDNDLNYKVFYNENEFYEWFNKY